MEIILVDNGKKTAIYHGVYKNKIGVYKTKDGVDGLMKAIGVRISKEMFIPDAEYGDLVDPEDGFPYHVDNLPDAEDTVTHKKPPKKPSKKK